MVIQNLFRYTVERNYASDTGAKEEREINRGKERRGKSMIGLFFQNNRKLKMFLITSKISGESELLLIFCEP